MFARALADGRFHAEDVELGGQPTFALARLAVVARSAEHPLALAGSFGDAVLLRELAPYRRMRARLLERGYAFVEIEKLAPGDRCASQLHLLTAIRQRRIPYRALGVALDDLLTRHPHARFDEAGLAQVCKGGVTSHEGAHALLFEAALASEGTLDGLRVVEALIAGEGFAMAFELWLALLLLAQPQRSLPIFFSLNAAQNPFSLAALAPGQPEVLETLAHLAVQKSAAVVKLFAAAGLVANLRPKARGAKDALVGFLMDFAGLEAAYEREAKILVRVALSLDESFRSTTATTFFRFNELEDEYRTVCAAPIEKHFVPGAIFHDQLPTVLAEVVHDEQAR